jgi:glucose-1-phosphate thymidylyltransferase
MIAHGIILCGGFGTRLKSHKIINKHLIPIHGKFILDYPLDSLRGLGITNLTAIVGAPHHSQIMNYLADGADQGFNINYRYQSQPLGIAQAINLCKSDIKPGEQFIVILGDNIYDGRINFKQSDKAQIVLCQHEELTRFGVASIKNNQIIKIEEKPKVIDQGCENYAVSGCYLFDYKFFEYFQQIKPSARNEYEITDIISLYLKDNNLDYTFFNGLWSDAGVHSTINYLNNYFYNKENLK